MNKKTILYLMHIDWRWIKQRPQFIAEGLSHFYDIKVAYFVSKRFIFSNTDIKSPNGKNIDLKQVFRLPFYQNRIIYGLNKFYLRVLLRSLIKKYDPDFIWITFPQLYDYIPPNSRCKVIYDCMDLSTGFNFPERFKSKISNLEEKLVTDADLVFVSSNFLFNRLDMKYQCGDKLVLIRNAFDGKIIDNYPETKAKKPYKIGYVGTISEWIDFITLKQTLEEIENIEYHFIGPYELKNIMNEDRIKFYGVINHENLYNYVKHFDCFIMPFKLNKLVKSVDPVKLYEYINYNKPIISVYYEELDYFSQFINFYSNIDELIDLLKLMIKNGFKDKYEDSRRINFLKENSWDIRINEIKDRLDKLSI